MTVQLLLGRRIASQADESTQLLSISIVIIAIISIINITIIIIGSSSSNSSSSSSSSVVLVVEIVNRAILLVPVKFVVEYHALLSIVFFCLRVVFLHYFLVSVSRFKLNHTLRNSIIVISLHVERNEDHDDRKDQNDQNTTLTAFTWWITSQIWQAFDICTWLPCSDLKKVLSIPRLC